MAAKRITTIFQFRRAKTAEWLANKDVIPAAGEPCFDLELHTLRIGDGVLTYENLPVIGGVDVKIEADGNSVVVDNDVFKLMGFDAAAVGAQPRKGEDGKLEWVVPSTEVIDNLKSEVSSLQTNVTNIQSSVEEIKEIVMPSGEGVGTLLERVQGLENEMNTIVSGLTDDGKVNTMMELIEYIDSHGKEAANMASDIKTLQELVGGKSVNSQIMDIVNNSEDKANAIFEHVKYEITNTPAGTLVDYRDKEIRVMVPANTVWTKQNVGSTGNSNMYYMAFKAYAPAGAVSFKEGDRGTIVDEMFDFNGDFAGTDKYGRNYSICWLALASYDEASGKWTYFGKNSTASKYIGWTYCVEWYDANGIKIGADTVRINLSNEDCHNIIEPFYMNSFVKGVKFNGTLMDTVNGIVDISIKSSDEIKVAEDGTLSVGTIDISKITQAEGTEIVLDGGSAGAR